ncbi:tumor protein D53 isoform X4 [Hirundo rustica]|uniref:tumor protein D53 isoform X4 n=1 Tax=Hirundo rustica TaxID=43150 RepID=UPI001A941D6A|nr:tumor protein D53 isoform X4 [Hirundo rustica]
MPASPRSCKHLCLLETQSFHEADEDVVTDVDFTNMISEEEKEELKIELAKLEDEISTLRQVLAAKEKHLVEIKQKLGISLMNELKQNFSKSWHDMQTTSAYKKTHETLSHAGQKATAAISNVGTAISKKFGDMRSHSIRFCKQSGFTSVHPEERLNSPECPAVPLALKYLQCIEKFKSTFSIQLSYPNKDSNFTE